MSLRRIVPAWSAPGIALALALGLVSTVSAQQRTGGGLQRSAEGAAGVAGSAADSIARLTKLLEDELGIVWVPGETAFHRGDLTIPTDSTVADVVAVLGGTLRISGTVTGNVVVFGGGVLVSEGGSVLGDAVAVGGRVRTEGGEVRGTALSLTGDLREPGARTPRRSAAEQTRFEVGVALSVLIFTVVMALGALAFGRTHLLGTAEALAARPARSFIMGVLAQFAILPALTLMVLALALTILGILLIPFAVVIFFLAVLGGAALGLLAAAHVAGMALVGGENEKRRPRHLVALITGTLLLGGLWVAAAAATAIPVAGALLRGLAMVTTWVAATAGFGATITSRAGRRRRAAAATGDHSLTPPGSLTATAVSTASGIQTNPAAAEGEKL